MKSATSPAETAPGSRLPWLDGLRGAAALAVLWHHFYVVVLHGFPEDGVLRASWLIELFLALGRWGSLGVPVFFVLSGFCVGQTWLRSDSWRAFALRRWWRIFPAYYMSIALGLACAVGAKLASGVNDVTPVPPLTAGNVLATLTLMTTPASSVPTTTWVYWSLTYEVAFYAVLTALLPLPSRWRHTAVGIVSVIACALTFTPELASRPGPLFFCDLWPLFGLGLALAAWPRAPKLAAIIGSAGAVALLAIDAKPHYPGYVVATLFALLLVGCVARDVRLPRFRPLEKIGHFSYSLYLIHVPVLLLLSRWLILRPAQTVSGLLIGCALAGIVILAVAWLFCRWFERPFLHPPRFRSAAAP